MKNSGVWRRPDFAVMMFAAAAKLERPVVVFQEAVSTRRFKVYGTRTVLKGAKWGALELEKDFRGRTGCAA